MAAQTSDRLASARAPLPDAGGHVFDPVKFLLDELSFLHRDRAALLVPIGN